LKFVKRRKNMSLKEQILEQFGGEESIGELVEFIGDILENHGTKLTKSITYVIRTFYADLIREGFNEEEALKITCSAVGKGGVK
jgi:hypothetical protein